MVDLTYVFQAVLGLLATLVMAFLIPWIKAKLSADKLAELVEWVGIGVAAAEQLYIGQGRGDEKKEYVLEFLAGKGYKVDAEILARTVNALIEAAVF